MALQPSERSAEESKLFSVTAPVAELFVIVVVDPEVVEDVLVIA